MTGDVTVSSSGSIDGTLHTIIADAATSSNGGATPTSDSGLDFSGNGLNPSASSGAAIIAVAGNVGFGKSNVGLSLVVNHIAQSNVAMIDGVTLTSGGTVAVSALNGADIIGVAFGVSVSTGGVAGVGSVAYNSIADSVIAQIGHDTFMAGDSAGNFAASIRAAAVTVTATDSATIRGAAGAIAINLGGGNAVGVSAVIDQISNYISAEIAGAQIRADQTVAGLSNSVTVAGSSTADITSVAIGAAATRGNRPPGVPSSQDNFRTLVGNLRPASPTSLAARGGSAAFFNFGPPPVPSPPPSNGISGAGSIVVSTEATTVNSYIGKGALSVGSDVDANGNVVVTAANRDKIAAYAGALSVSAGAGSGIGISFVLNTISGNTLAYVSNSSVDAQGVGTGAVVDNGLLTTDIDPKASRTPASNPSFSDGTNTVSGIAIVATEQQIVDTVAVVASISTSDNAIAANAITNTMSGNTKAYADASTLNTHLQTGATSDVQITAASRVFANNLDIGVALSGGTAAGTIVLLLNKMDGQTSAYANNTSIGTAVGPAGNIAIRADAWEGTVGEAVGLAVSGGLGVSGSALVNIFGANTSAYLTGGATNAGSLDVEATTKNGYFAAVGNAAVGSTAGVGASVIVGLVNNTTQAYVGSPTTSSATSVTLGGPLTVAAKTITNTQSYEIGAGIGGTAGISATVTFSQITNQTLAQIANATVLVPSTVDPASGTITVSSTETTSLNSLVGGLAGGGSAGVGASANIMILKSSNAARILGSTVTTPGEVDVLATSTRDIGMITTTAGLGGAAGIAGNVGVIIVGDSASSDQSSSLGDNVTSASMATGQSLSGALGAGIDGISATVEGGTVTANTVKIHAAGYVATSNVSGSLAVGGLAGFGAAVAYTTVQQAVTAKATGGALHVSTLDVNATAGDDPAGGVAVGTMALAGAGGFVGVGAAVAVSQDKNKITALVGSTVNGGTTTAGSTPVTLTSGSVTISANDASSVRSDAYGGAGGFAAIGASVATASRTSVVIAEVLTGLDPTISTTSNVTAAIAANNVSIAADDSGQTYALAIAGGAGAVAGVGATALADNSSTVTASVAGASTIVAPNLNSSTVQTYGLSLSASDTPDTKAFSFGVAIGAAGLGASVSQATVGGSITANVDGTAVLAGTNGLKVAAESKVSGTPATSFPSDVALPGNTSEFRSGTSNAAAWSIAGSGGYFYAANATDAKATNSESVTAQTGNNLVLPGGAVVISATSNNLQYAQGTGVSVGGLAVGLVLVNAQSSVNTTAQLGTSTTSPVSTSSNPLMSLKVSASGTDMNSATSQAGAGGVYAGNGSQAQTTDTATTIASIGANSAIGARSISISADHTDNFYQMADSLNAAALGASAALANHTAQSDVRVTIGDNVMLDASAAGMIACMNNACAQAISITASNAFNDNGSGTRAAAGGGVNGAGATSIIDLGTSNASISIGAGDHITSGTDAGIAPGGIAVVASTTYAITDTDTLYTGGYIQGAGVSSTIRGTLSNTITVNAGAQLATKGSIDLATWTQGSASANGYVTTFGLAAVGVANAYVDITNNHTINLIGSTSSTPSAWTTLAAFYDVFVQAGDYGGHGISSSYDGATVASGYVRGLIAIPSVDASTNMAVNATISLPANTAIYAGQNVKVEATHGTPTVNSNGTGHGFELFLIPVTRHSSNQTAPTTSDVTIGGKIVAGQYSTLTLTVNADGTVTENAGGAPVGYSYLSNATASCANALSSTCLFTADEYTTLLNSGNIASGAINAIRFGGLFASAGNVTIKADTIHGHGAVSAFGSPSITVTNPNNIALVFYGGAYIPDITGAGQIVYTGGANKDAANAAGITNFDAGSNASAPITISQTYAGGDRGTGPAIIIDAPITSLGGSIAIKNANGSLIYQTVYALDANGNALDGSNGQAARVVSIGGTQAPVQNIDVPHGALIIHANTPDGLYVAGASPATEYLGTAYTPGVAKDGIHAAVINPADAIQYVAASIYHNNLQASLGLVGPNSGDPGNVGINGVLYGSQGPNTNTQYSLVLLDGCQFINIGCTTGSSYYTTSDGRPHVRYTDPSLTYSVSTNAINTAGSLQSKQIYGNLIEVHAATIDVNGAIYAGPATNYNVSISDGAGIRAGGSRDITNKLSFGSNSASDVTATYDASSNQITLSKIDAYSTGAKILLDGNIISTNTLGNIHINSGFGQVAINNTTGIPLVIQDVNTGSAATAAAATSTVTILDRMKTSRTELNGYDTTTYIYNPGAGLKQYLTRNGAAPVDASGALINNAVLGLRTPTGRPSRAIRLMQASLINMCRRRHSFVTSLQLARAPGSSLPEAAAIRTTMFRRRRRRPRAATCRRPGARRHRSARSSTAARARLASSRRISAASSGMTMATALTDLATCSALGLASRSGPTRLATRAISTSPATSAIAAVTRVTRYSIRTRRSCASRARFAPTIRSRSTSPAISPASSTSRRTPPLRSPVRSRIRTAVCRSTRPLAAAAHRSRKAPGSACRARAFRCRQVAPLARLRRRSPRRSRAALAQTSAALLLTPATAASTSISHQARTDSAPSRRVATSSSTRRVRCCAAIRASSPSATTSR